MRGEGRCQEAPEDSAHYPAHCVHVRYEPDEMICCWCGDLFEGVDVPRGEHGDYIAPVHEYTILELWNGAWWRWYMSGGKPIAFIKESPVLQPGYTPVSETPHDAPGQTTAPIEDPST